MSSKNSPKRTSYKNLSAEERDSQSNPAVRQTQADQDSYKFPMQRLPLIFLFFVITLGGASIVLMRGGSSEIKEYGFEVKAEYPHDSGAFTQGLYFDGEYLWESTGILRDASNFTLADSTIRKCNLDGDVLIKKDVPDVFGEGLVRIDDKIIQLTWKDKIGFVYDTNLELEKQFDVDFQGWGLTYDGRQLIVSDGTSVLRFLDPETFKVQKEMVVKSGKRRFLGQLNELEYINNRIYANAWKEDYIYIIEPESGSIEARIDLRKLFPWSKRPSNREAVLNGIAVNPDTERLLVTGKLWPYVFEIELVENNE